MMFGMVVLVLFPIVIVLMIVAIYYLITAGEILWKRARKQNRMKSRNRQRPPNKSLRPTPAGAGGSDYAVTVQ
jgi:hypothetical protein